MRRRAKTAARVWQVPVAGVLCLGSALAVSGGEKFWKTKPVGEWTRQETVRFFCNSPWVRRGTVQISPPETGLHGDAGSAREGLGEARQPSRGGDNSNGESSGQAREWVYYVQWDSAQIVRDAAEHLHELSGKGEQMRPAAGNNDYLVTVTGPDIDKMLAGVTVEQLQAEGHLHAGRTKTKIHPTRVVIRKTANGRIDSVEFTFPRALNGQPVIPSDVDFIRFYCKAKGVALRARFDLPEMITARGRDL